MQQSNPLTFPRPFRRSQQKPGCRDSDTRSSADAAVIATNDDAAISKASCVSCGYFEDRFLRHFVGGGLASSSSSSFPSPSLPRRPPLINRGYFCRHAALSGLVDAFLSRVAEKNKGAETPIKSQIVSLGAGSDTLFFRLHDAGRAPDFFVELDLAEVVSKKASIIASNPELASRVGFESSSFDGRQMTTSRYALLPCDLRSPRPVSTAISKASSPSPSSSSFSFDPAAPTLFLSECVLVYLPVEAGDEVLRDAAEMMKVSTPSEKKKEGEAAIVVYDPCRPSTPFGRQMRQNLRARGCELAGFDAFEDPGGAEERLQRCGGWECGRGNSSSASASGAETLRRVWERRLPDEARARASRVEQLDELEEWNLIMEHYFLAVGVLRRKGNDEGGESSSGGGGGVFDGFGLASLRERR